MMKGLVLGMGVNSVTRPELNSVLCSVREWAERPVFSPLNAMGKYLLRKLDTFRCDQWEPQPITLVESHARVGMD